MCMSWPAWQHLLFTPRRDRRELLREPVGREGGHLLERARLLEEVRRIGNHGEPVRAHQACGGVSVELEHDGVGTSDYEERRCLDVGEPLPGEIGTPSSRR